MEGIDTQTTELSDNCLKPLDRGGQRVEILGVDRVACSSLDDFFITSEIDI